MDCDVLELNEFLDNSVNPFKWINEIVVFDKKSKKFHKVSKFSIMSLEKNSESMVIEFE